jgi:hypothetical protein
VRSAGGYVQVLRDLSDALARRAGLAHQAYRLGLELFRERLTRSAHRHTLRLGLSRRATGSVCKPRQAQLKARTLTRARDVAIDEKPPPVNNVTS